jgi:hypothetical protein
MNLRVVDKFNDLLVSAYVTAARTRLLLLHDNRNDDGIHAFFKEVRGLALPLQRERGPGGLTREAISAFKPTLSDEKVANRDIRVWHATENGP